MERDEAAEVPAGPPPLIVLDTVVVVAPLLGRADSSSAEVVREVATGGVRLALSDDFLVELTRKVQDPSMEGKIGSAGRAFEIAFDLGFMGLPPPPGPLPLEGAQGPEGSVRARPGRGGRRRLRGHLRQGPRQRRPALGLRGEDPAAIAARAPVPEGPAVEPKTRPPRPVMSSGSAPWAGPFSCRERRYRVLSLATYKR